MKESAFEQLITVFSVAGSLTFSRQKNDNEGLWVNLALNSASEEQGTVDVHIKFRRGLLLNSLKNLVARLEEEND